MSLSVEPARSRGAFRAFLRLPWRIYEDDPAWVPPILRDVSSQFDRRKHPFFLHGEVEPFVAWRGRRPVGRIVAILDRTHLARRKDGLGFFGFLEMEEDAEIARALIGAAAGWLEARGAERMLGPVQFTMNDTCGILVEGFDDPPVILMPHNPPYYGPLLEGAGMRSAKLLLAYLLTRETKLLEKVRRVADRAERRGIRVRQVDLGDFEREVARAREVYNSAMDANWGFDPMTEEEFRATAKDLRRGADPRLLLLAEVDGAPVGFAASVPDLNQAIRRLNGRLTPWGILRAYLASRRIKRIRTMVLCVVRAYRRRGVDALLVRETVDRGLAAGYIEAELSWVLEDNHLMIRSLEEMGAVVYKRYRLFEGETSSGASSDLPR